MRVTPQFGGATIAPVAFAFLVARLAKLVDRWDERRIRAGKKVVGVRRRGSSDPPHP